MKITDTWLFSGEIGVFPILSFFVGAWALLKYIVSDIKLNNESVWKIVLLSSTLPAFCLFGFGTEQAKTDTSLSYFLILNFSLVVFWPVFWWYAIWKDTWSSIAAKFKIERNKVPKFLALGVIFLAGTTMAYAYVAPFALNQAQDECTRVKCVAGEFLIGKRSTILIWLWFASMFSSPVIAGLTLNTLRMFNPQADDK